MHAAARTGRLGTAALLAVITACSGPAATAIVASSPQTIGVGSQRLVVGLVDESTEMLGGPELPVDVEVRREGRAIAETAAEWVWTIDGARGFFVVTVDLPEPGRYDIVLRPEGLPPTEPVPFEALAEVTVPEVGRPAPPSETPTHPPRPLEEITTDRHPDPSFYERSVAEAVTGGSTSVIVFASPAFCQTATCGPVLDRIAELAPRHPEVTFVHVEVYENLDAAAGEPLREAEAVLEWGLPSEPWVFVVGPDGTIRSRFEGMVSTVELEAALG